MCQVEGCVCSVCVCVHGMCLRVVDPPDPEADPLGPMQTPLKDPQADTTQDTEVDPLGRDDTQCIPDYFLSSHSGASNAKYCQFRLSCENPGSFIFEISDAQNNSSFTREIVIAITIMFKNGL